jgi:hypothetical protein
VQHRSILERVERLRQHVLAVKVLRAKWSLTIDAHVCAPFTSVGHLYPVHTLLSMPNRHDCTTRSTHQWPQLCSGGAASSQKARPARRCEIRTGIRICDQISMQACARVKALHGGRMRAEKHHQLRRSAANPKRKNAAASVPQVNYPARRRPRVCTDLDLPAHHSPNSSVYSTSQGTSELRNTPSREC